MQRIFAIVLIFLLQFQIILGSVFAGDSTSFNPVPITVVAKGAGGVPVGTIIAWPVAQNPSDMENWLECNGQSISASVYPELFALVGGKVPDFRGKSLYGRGGSVPTGAVYVETVYAWGWQHNDGIIQVNVGGVSNGGGGQAAGNPSHISGSGHVTINNLTDIRFLIRVHP